MVFVVAVELESDSFSKLPSIGAIAKMLVRFGSASTTSFVRLAKSKSESRLKLGELKSDSLDESSDCGESGRESVVSLRGSIPAKQSCSCIFLSENEIYSNLPSGKRSELGGLYTVFVSKFDDNV